jgi:hypothetical protein
LSSFAIAIFTAKTDIDKLYLRSGLEKIFTAGYSYQKELYVFPHINIAMIFKITEINTLYLLKLPYSYYSGEMAGRRTGNLRVMVYLIEKSFLFF